MPFLSIAKEKIENFLETRKCPDQFVGKIVIYKGTASNPPSNEHENDFLQRRICESSKRGNKPIIIMVLESPHLSEFAGHHPQPAAGNGYGSTGTAIRQLFKLVCRFDALLADGSYDLLIMNAVQYQCSLGVNTKIFRDTVFSACWSEFGKVDFNSRLTSIYRFGDILINACTKGQHSPYLRELVKEELEDIIKRKTDIQIYHPSGWKMVYNTAFKKGSVAKYSWG